MKIRFTSSKFRTKRASHRLRGEVTCQALAAQGYDAKVLTDWDEIDSDTLVIFLKLSQVEQIQEAKRRGAKTIYDLCDNKFDEQPEYAPCCMAADLVTVNSVQMGMSVKEHTGRDSIVMPDPFERPKLAPAFAPGEDLKLLWFGSQSSFKFLPIVELWQRLENEIKNYQYTMVSSKTERLLSKMMLRQSKGAVNNINFDRIDMQTWTWELQGQLLQDCDIVLMPVLTENPRTDTKSANRVIDSLMSGRFVITTPLASYEEFAPYTWQGDYIEGIKWACANPTKVVEMITAGQKYTEEHYSAQMLSKQFVDSIITQVKK